MKLSDNVYAIRDNYRKQLLDAGGDGSYITDCSGYCSEWQKWRID